MGRPPTIPSDTSTTTATRELAAIMFSDIVGYTAIMGRDEREGLRAVREHRAHLREVLPKFNGRLIGEIGDGTLSSFHSAVDAVNCARELQAALVDDPELRLRIGIHVGDVVFTDNTVLGDGVNIASRLNAIAAPGGVCISERVYEDVRNKPEIKARDLGEQRLKNVSRPIHAYLIVGDGLVAQPAEISGGRRRIVLIVGAGAVVLAAIVLALVRLRSPAPAPPQTTAKPARMRSIAVLPLENLSHDPSQEYFADGMTDELITDLAKIRGLRVISRTSVMKFKGEHREQLPEIAKALNVDTIVEGSVLRVGDQVRISAQLIDAPSDKHLWAESYERDTRDVLALQDEVALAIARQINVELTSQERARLANARPVNPQAYEAYLKGRYFLSEFSGERLKKAFEQFELAIKLDPNFALPYTGLSDAYGWAKLVVPPAEVMPKAKAATEKALQLDDSLAEAHTSLGIIKFTYDFDWTAAEREFHRALELNPGYAYAHNQYGALLDAQGRFDEALAEHKRASELDPLSVQITNEVAWPLMSQGKYEAAKEQIRRSLELDPDDLLAHWALGYIDIQAGKFNGAIPELEKVQAINSSFPPCYLGYAYAAAGERAKAEAALVEVNQLSSRQYLSPMCSARIYVGLGEKGRALDELEKAYDDRSSNLPWLKVDKTWDPLRSEPRFIALLKKVGLDK
jgi:adenylate cyclase